MVGAKLWKRILNEGFSFDDDLIKLFGCYDSLITKIISSPIITDERPASGVCKIGGPGEQIAIPFDSFWMEFPGRTNTIYGSFVRREGSRVTFYSLGAYRNERPIIRSFVNLELDDHKEMIAYSMAYSKRHAIEQGWSLPWSDLEDGHSENEILQSHLLTPAALCWDTLLLLSCKNVSLNPHPMETTHREHRYAKRLGGEGSYRYHTLVVRPAGAHKNSPAQEIGIMPRHVCRGHFAEYGPEFGKGLLFGRLSGRFYVPPHLKGKEENGIVEKDYMVKPWSTS